MGHFCNVGAYGIPRIVGTGKRTVSNAAITAAATGAVATEAAATEASTVHAQHSWRKYDFEPDNKRLEVLLHEHGGRKVYYSHAFYDRDFFYRELYDGDRYFSLRRRYCPDDALPEIYDKVITKNGNI